MWLVPNLYCVWFSEYTPITGSYTASGQPKSKQILFLPDATVSQVSLQKSQQEAELVQHPHLQNNSQTQPIRCRYNIFEIAILMKNIGIDKNVFNAFGILLQGNCYFCLV